MCSLIMYAGNQEFGIMLEITKTQDDGTLKTLNLNEAVSGSWFNCIEDSLKKTTHNKALFQLMEIQKSLVYFTTALKDNQLVLQKLLRMVNAPSLQSILKFTEDDIDMLEDVIIENKQAAEMVEMHSTILESMMDCMASIINNNLNLVMKFLAAITIIMSIPTMIGSFWGMNVPMPFGENSFGFLIVISISIIATCIAAVFFNRKGMM